MRSPIAPLLAMPLLLLTACRSEACPAGSITYFPDIASLPTADGGALLPIPAPVEVEIGGRTIQVDRVIHGPLCTQALSGTVYVACDLQIVEWDHEQAPTFLRDCDFTVEPGTVVYVAAHQETAYYQGCSCHTDE
jgi:hypothetical protein